MEGETPRQWLRLSARPVLRHGYLVLGVGVGEAECLKRWTESSHRTYWNSMLLLFFQNRQAEVVTRLEFIHRLKARTCPIMSAVRWEISNRVLMVWVGYGKTRAC